MRTLPSGVFPSSTSVPFGACAEAELASPRAAVTSTAPESAAAATKECDRAFHLSSFASFVVGLQCLLLSRDEDAVDEELDRTGGQADGVHRVCARESRDLESVVGDFGVEDLDRWCKSAHLHDVCVAAHVDGVVSVRGVDNDAVGLAVAGGSADGAC